MFALVTKESLTKPQEGIPLEAQPILKEFNSVFPEDLPNELPPLCDI